jgi:branched-chain amino acid transport system substrate-binding protein
MPSSWVATGICTTKVIELTGNAMGNDHVVCAKAGGVTGERGKAFADFHEHYKKRFKMDVPCTRRMGTTR